MSISLLSHTGSGDGTTTPAIDTTGATLLVCSTSTDSSPAPTDNMGNTWVLAVKSGNGGSFNNSNAIYYVENPTTSASHTFTPQGSLPGFAVAAFSGTLTSSSLDQTNSTASSTSPGSITPGVDNELIITGEGGSASGTVTIDLGFTILEQYNGAGGATYGAGIAYLIQTTATAVNPTWTWTVFGGVCCTIASFKAAAGGAVVNSNFLTFMGPQPQQ